MFADYLPILDAIVQVGISTLGVVAIILVSKKNKWGFVFGLASQPFWFATSIINQQWGIFFLSVVYAVCWIYGINQWFFKDGKVQVEVEQVRNDVVIEFPKQGCQGHG